MKLMLIFLFLIPQLIFSQKEQKRIALVIGNGNYLYGSSLKNPVNDAELIANTLSQLGFTVIKHTNIKHKQVHNAVIDFAKKLDKYDVALFYYAGHGAQIDGINYLIPVDARPYTESDLRFEAIQISEIVKEFEYHTNNINIVILDACRSNPFRSWSRGSETGFKAINPPSGTIIAFATSEGENAADGSNKNGLYTSELAKQLLIPQRIEDVFINTRIAVENASNGNQSPQEWSKLRGKFYFKKPDKNLILLDTSQSKNNKAKNLFYGNNRSFTNSKSGIKMIKVEGGFFQMGSSKGKKDEYPQHKVELDDFSLSKYEITNEQYCKFLNYMHCNKKAKFNNIQYLNTSSSFCEIEYKKGRFYTKQGKSNHPVVEVSWYGANAYCKWMGGRLPTEAEWEYAAKGASVETHSPVPNPFGSRASLQSRNYDIDKIAWYNKNSRSHSHPVGQKNTNMLGFHDMNGNVWEWCTDWYDKNYYAVSDVKNPKNTIPSEFKILRGGSWKNTAYSCRSLTRYKLEAKKSAKNIGFRVCLSNK